MTDSALAQLGVDLDNIYTSAGELPIEQGIQVRTKNGKAVLAQAAGTISRGQIVILAPSSAAASASVVATLTTTDNIFGGTLAIYQHSAPISANKYGWFYTEGTKEVVVQASTGCVPGNAAKMYFAADGDGAVDDATTSTAILGIEILATASGGTTAVPCIFSNMKAQDTA